ncbi:methyl-accepting chemotaxis protein [Herbaspirillum sp. SJZ107]|uniref:methyl-accepting chemotaxis protein n=1 Tax=Herbaspirillum sp. SJZ107 TaxID=2572881 RepID=UPI00116A690B|nr:methyl-accepting chemotaxis sensory transducer with TarH sensor [Herbaspirillum sp. SJZ107]
MSVVALLIGIILAVGALGYHSTQSAVELLEGVALRDARQQGMISNIMLRMETNRSQLLQALQHNPATDYAKLHDHPLTVHFKQIADNTAALEKARDDFDASLRTPAAKAIVHKWYAQSSDLGIADVRSATQALEAGQWDEAQRILITRVNPAYKRGQSTYDELQALLDERGHTNAELAISTIGTNDAIMVAAIVAGCLAGVAAAMFLARSIVKPLGEAVAIARKVAKGDLSADLRTDARNEFGQLLGALGEMNGSLANIVGEVRAEADTIASASSQISAATLDLSGRTERQASTLEETSASVEELSATVKQNADNARQANALAASASAIAVKGGATVGAVVDTMGAIQESASKIADIIGVIDGIAFQTNILALNAAVEAARAGEQGRGFAVVASEVRSLAQRSATAAREIKELINDSVEKVDSGSRMVDQAGATMQEVVDSIRRVADIMNEITVASQEQSTGIEQIHQAVSQMDQVTQQNAAMVEEAAGASSSLQEQAAGLARLVSVFRLGGHGHGADARPVATTHAPARPVAARLPSLSAA